MLRSSLAVAVCLLFSLSAYSTTYVVNDLGDAPDASAGNDVCATAGAMCTLRAAIQEANAHAGSDSIAFSVAGTIAPATTLPEVTSTIAIDGTTAPGYAGTPVVVLAGTLALGDGLAFGPFDSTGSSVRGLKIHGFLRGLDVTRNVTVQRNYLGPVGGGSPNTIGLVLTGSATGCTIGGTAGGDGNVISGNTTAGIHVIYGLGGNTIADNFIGTNASGSAALPNGDGILVWALDSTPFTSIGGPPGAENVISGNTRNGVLLDGGAQHEVAGNYIGTDVTGMIAIPNDTGVTTVNADGNRIGTPALANVISGNTSDGVVIGAGDAGSSIENNLIGLNAAGTAPLPNASAGVRVLGTDTQVGTPAGRNVISGNGVGVVIETSTRPVVRSNIIGLDRTGTVAVMNTTGIFISGDGRIVGGTGPGDGNTISGNNGAGIFCFGCGNVEIYGNTIGLTVDRDTARGNNYGIWLYLYSQPGPVTIGSAGSAMNVISGNRDAGIAVWGPPPSLTIANNRIGTDGTGMIAIGNGGPGIEWANGLASDAGTIVDNLISGNAAAGIRMTGLGTRTLFRNIIGRNATNSAPLPNGGSGIRSELAGNVTMTIGSLASGGNIIASNAGDGITVLGGTTTIAANPIFANGGLGIDLNDDGVTSNDPQDPDSGPNARQNFPVINSSTPGGSIQGTLNSTPSTTFALHFYASPTADPSGYGEGQTYLGTTNVTTNASGNAAFVWNGPALAAGELVTATATGPSGTSEFSAAVVVAPAAAATPIPTASTWALLAMLAALSAIGLLRTR